MDRSEAALVEIRSKPGFVEWVEKYYGKDHGWCRSKINTVVHAEAPHCKFYEEKET